MSERLRLRYGEKEIKNLIDIGAFVSGNNYQDLSNSALAGGITEILTSPNPPITSVTIFENEDLNATSMVNCLYGFYAYATETNHQDLNKISSQVSALQIDIRNIGRESLEKHFKSWNHGKPICIKPNQGDLLLKDILDLSQKYDRPLHIHSISTREEINLVKSAKQKGQLVTCDTTPIHLGLDQNLDVPYLWQAVNKGIIDMISSDHESTNLTPDMTIKLMLNAVKEKRMTLERLVEMMSTKPQEVFHLISPIGTYSVIDLNTSEAHLVYIYGELVYQDGEIFPRYQRTTPAMQYNGKR